jgi:hypothetical protein
MDRRMRTAMVAAVVCMVVLVLAASSGPFDVWRTPPSSGDVATVVTDPPQEVQPQEPAPDQRREMPSWLTTVWRVIGIALAVAALAFALLFLRFLRFPSITWSTRLRRRSNDAAALPEEDAEGVTLDVDSARAALVGGTARNAIVACWMQLERDAATAGLPRLPAETPTEYAQRVIGASSVDPAPIGQLAALYREARFSRHELDDLHRARALTALDRVAAALQHDAEARS